MKELIAGFVGLLVGGALSFFYATVVIERYKNAAAEVGVFFRKAEGKLAAIKKAL